MGITKNLRATLKSTPTRKTEINRLIKMLDEKKEKGVLKKKSYDLPPLNDVERHFYRLQSGDWNFEKCR